MSKRSGGGGHSKEQLYTQDARIWVPDSTKVWKGAKVTKALAQGQLTYALDDDPTNETVLKITEDNLNLPPLRNPDILVGKNDLTSLSYLHEPAVLYNLEYRFVEMKDTIYTYCGIVLVAINPYEELDIYGPDTIWAYRGQEMGDLDPHIFAVAEEAYTKMERDGRDQSIIVSGESGAGKTVSAKYAMRYFATVGGSENETQIERKVLASSPIMEAIGNAKTTRNDNSSRFGKYVELHFDNKFGIIGASMRTYLLEKSRVVKQAENERNFHIFYQMCSARGTHSELSELFLDDCDAFHYSRQGHAGDLEGVNDCEGFTETVESLKLLGFGIDNRRNFFKLLAGILHLGNIKFIESGDKESSHVAKDDPHLEAMCSLLGLDFDGMRKWLCNRKIVTGKEEFVKGMTESDASFARDALAKLLYAEAFQWIVENINHCLKTIAKVNRFIGVLDIYGFETFECNSFEQFCINYANEKLQQQFNQHVFKLEQEEYVKEGIEWTFIEFYDNQPCIDLIETKLGILDLLDEECRMPKGSDSSWCNKLYTQCSKWNQFSKPRMQNPDPSFLITHFADRVEYQSTGFLEKNRDTVLQEHILQMRSAKNEWLVGLLTEKQAMDPKGKPKIGALSPPAVTTTLARKKTVGSQFRESLTLLMASLNATTPHYVRCIKPNDDKAAFLFDNNRAVQQLRACGVLETIRISAAGFPSRWTYLDFFSRYRVLCHSKDINRMDHKVTCEKIVKKIIDDEDEYRFGKTKIFFRAGQVAFMEKMRFEKLKQCGVLIQKTIRGWVCRNRYKRMKKSSLLIQRYGRGMLARRHALLLRQTAAAIIIQTNFRRFAAVRRYKYIKEKVIRLQSRMRGFLARRKTDNMKKVRACVKIQRLARGYLSRQRYKLKLKRVVLAQCCIRRYLAKKKLKTLKIEARSVDHVKKLNKGLENKIISLQQRIETLVKEQSNLVHFKNDYNNLKSELDTYKGYEAQLKAARAKEAELSETIVTLEGKLKTEMDNNIDVVSQNSILEEEKRKLIEESAKLKNEVSEVKGEVLIHKQHGVEEAKLQKELENQNKERDIEKQAYQQLLRKFHEQESILTTMQQARAKALRNQQQGSPHRNPVPLPRRALHQRQDSEDLNQSSGVFSSQSSDSSLQNNNSLDVGLVLTLQQKLRDSDAERHRLERVFEDNESTPLNETRRAQDLIRLQELEMENSKLRDDVCRLRQAIALEQDEGVEAAAKEEFLRQINNAQEELSRKREESIQLRTILSGAAVPVMTSDDENEMSLILSTQKQMIQALEVELLQKSNRLNRLTKEVQTLTKETEQQQTLLNKNLNSSQAVDAHIKNQVTRLTGENADLREQNEKLLADVRLYKKQLKGQPQESDIDVSQVTPGLQVQVSRKKDREYLGMLEYQAKDEQQILKALIVELQPSIAQTCIPGLPAYIWFMLIRYTDYRNDDERVRSLLTTGIGSMKKLMKRKGTQLDITVLWLCNILRLLHSLKQYSGDAGFQQENTQKQNEQALKNFDLSEYRQVLSDHAVWIYTMVIKILEDQIQAMIVPAILENKGIETGMGMSGPRSRSQSVSSESGKPLDGLLRQLDSHYNLLASFGMDPEVIMQVFKQLFYYICAGAMNNLLLRRELCHWEKGVEIRFNVSSLEEWARGKKFETISTTLLPVIQASQLLQARKTDSDVESICEICEKLSVPQVVKLLNLFQSKDGFEQKVSKGFIERVQNRLLEQRQKELLAAGNTPPPLLMDAKFAFAVRFPFNPSSIRLEDLSIPETFGISKMVKRM